MEPVVKRHDPDRGRARRVVRLRAALIGIPIVVVIAAASFGAARVAAARRLQSELAHAREEMSAGLFALARARLTLLSAAHPDEPEIAYQLGHCEAARDRPDAALRNWVRIPADSRWAAPAALNFAQTALSLGRITEAEQVLRAAMGKASPELPFLRRTLLIIIGQQGRLSEARALIQNQWQVADPNGGSGLSDRLAMLREHVGLDFEPFPLEWNLAQLERESTSAREEDRRALALARAYLATRSGNFEGAKAGLLVCLERWPADPEVWKSWLDMAQAADQVDLATRALEHVPARTLDGPRILSLRAWFARARQDMPGERRWLKELIAVDPGRTSALTRLAELSLKSGDTREAEQLRREKTALDAAVDRFGRLYREDRYGDHLEELARLAERLGRWFEARAFWELVRITSPSNAEAVQALAQVGRRRIEAPASASGTLQDLLALEPETTPKPPGRLDHRSGIGRGANPVFEDRASVAGLGKFVLDNGLSAIHQLPEMSCGGVGLLDFDGDGFMDVYAVQGGPFPPGADRLYTGDRLFATGAMAHSTTSRQSRKSSRLHEATDMVLPSAITTTTVMRMCLSHGGALMRYIGIGVMVHLKIGHRPRACRAIATGRRRRRLPIWTMTATSTSMSVITASGIR